MPNNLPSAAAIDMPSILISGQYDPHDIDNGQMLHTTAVIGMFKHELTTDLLNHLIIIQKVFMKVSEKTLSHSTDILS